MELNYDELASVLKNSKEKAYAIFKNNYNDVVKLINTLNGYQLDQILKGLFYNTDILCQYADVFTSRAKTEKSGYIHHLLNFNVSNSAIVKAYDTFLLDNFCFGTEYYKNLEAVIFKIDNHLDKVLDLLKNAPATKKSKVVYQLRTMMEPNQFAQLLNDELKKAKGDYQTELKRELKNIEQQTPVNFALPAYTPISNDDTKPITLNEAKAQANSDVNDDYNDWLEKCPQLDLAECVLLANTLQITDREKELLVIYNKALNGNNLFFTYAGHGAFALREAFDNIDLSVVSYINSQFRVSYTELLGNEYMYEMRYINFNSKILERINDLRQILPMLEKQNLIPDLNIYHYLASSVEAKDIKEKPEVFYPFFAEHYEFLDAAFCQYNKSRLEPIDRAVALAALKIFPEIPQRYVYPLIETLFDNDNAEDAFDLLRTLPDVKQIFDEYYTLHTAKDQKTLQAWMDELDVEKCQTPKRCFELKDGASNKFWNIIQNGREYEVEFGSIGGKARVNTKDYDSMAKCRIAMDKIIAQKINEGYVETAPLAEKKAVQLDINEPILQANAKPYVCELKDENGENCIVTDLKDKQHLKATLQYLIKLIKAKTDSGADLDDTGLFNIHQLNKSGKVEELNSKNEYYSFHTFTKAASKHKELYAWMAALLESILYYNEPRDKFKPLWLNEEWVVGTALAFELAQDSDYKDLFIRFMRSIAPLDNHTAYAKAYENVKLPIDAELHLLASYCCVSTCMGDFESYADGLLSEFIKWNKAKQNSLLAFMQTECMYMLKERKRMDGHVARGIEVRIGSMLPDEDAGEMANRIVDLSKGRQKLTLELLLSK